MKLRVCEINEDIWTETIREPVTVFRKQIKKKYTQPKQ